MPHSLPFHIYRAEPVDLSSLSINAQYQDHVEQEEIEETHDRMWNEFVVPEIDSVYELIDPRPKMLGEDTVQKANTCLERDTKYRQKAIVEWHRRFVGIRYIDGYFYAFRFGSGLILYDCFSLVRWRPAQFAFQVQAWLDAEAKVAKTREAAVRLWRILSALLAVVVLIMSAFLIGP